MHKGFCTLGFLGTGRTYTSVPHTLPLSSHHSEPHSFIRNQFQEKQAKIKGNDSKKWGVSSCAQSEQLYVQASWLVIFACANKFFEDPTRFAGKPPLICSGAPWEYGFLAPNRLSLCSAPPVTAHHQPSLSYAAIVAFACSFPPAFSITWEPSPSNLCSVIHTKEEMWSEFRIENITWLT